MSDKVPEAKDVTLDIETWGTVNNEDGQKDMAPGSNQATKFCSRVWNSFLRFDESAEGEEVQSLSKNDTLDSSGGSTNNVALPEGKKPAGEEKVGKDAKKENPKKKGCKKPPKPPRPPKPPSLSAADMKLVKELTELAMLKRARIERRKALKKLKAAKAASSSNNSLLAMVITIIFFLVIFLHGVFFRGSSSAYFNGSPESAVEARGGLISVQYYGNALASSSHSPDPRSQSPDLIKQVSRGGTKEVVEEHQHQSY